MGEGYYMGEGYMGEGYRAVRHTRQLGLVRLDAGARRVRPGGAHAYLRGGGSLARLDTSKRAISRRGTGVPDHWDGERPRRHHDAEVPPIQADLAG